MLKLRGWIFDEVFAPVARLETVRVLLALAAQGNWEVHRTIWMLNRHF
jgi:hypothetical protein